MKRDRKHDRVHQLRVVVEVTDYDEALGFFRDVLGLPEQAAFAEGVQADDRVAILSAGAATLELATPSHAESVDRLEGLGESRGPRIRLAFQVDDAAATAAVAVRHGADELAPPVRTPWRSLNARLQAPGDLEITVFQELGR